MTRFAHRLSIPDARRLIAKALETNGTSSVNAESVARALVAAEVDGQKGHGFSRVAAYAAQSRSGKVQGRAAPRTERISPAFARIDAGNGFAFPAIDEAVNTLAELASETTIAGASIVRSHHCGQLGAHVERLAERGLVAIMVANAPKAMAPWGGGQALFGTNPIAFAAPMEGAPPLVIDLSLSKAARGKVMAAAKAGERIPEGIALDAAGSPTTDARSALEGTMIPMGDAKGAALALMVEILAATLTGATPSSRATSFFDAEGAPPGVGQFIIAIQPNAVLGAAFAPQLSSLAAEITAQPGARLPGTRRLALRAEAEANGLDVPEALLTEVRALVGG